MIGTLVAASWLTTSGISSIALGRFRFSVIAKYTAPLHLVCLCIAAIFLSWQATLYILAFNLGLACAASHVYGQFKEDSSTELPDLKNQLEALKEGPPYNFLCGRFYPKENVAPLAATAHTIDLLWRYINKIPTPDSEEEKRALEERAEKTHKCLRQVTITDEKVAPKEQELLYWHTYINPIDARWALEIKPALLRVRLLLGEPLPTADLAQLQKIEAPPGLPDTSLTQPPGFPEITAWVAVYNKEPALQIEHLFAAFMEIWNDETKARKTLFILMRDYGLAHDKRPKGLQLQGPANLDLPRLTSGREGLAYAIQSEYVWRRPRKTSEPTGQSSFIQDRFKLLETLLYFQQHLVVPELDWERDFSVTGGVPDLSNPFFHSHQLNGDYSAKFTEWREEVMASLLKDLHPFDGRKTTQWRLFLLKNLSAQVKGGYQKEALESLCLEPDKPSCWTFACRGGAFRLSGMQHLVSTYNSWRPQAQALVKEVKRKYGLTDDKHVIRGIARAFNLEWEDPASPLRSLTFLEKWPVSWWLKVIERGLAKVASQVESRGTFLELCEK